ncbi:MAG TPA: hypothetical protein DEV81_08085 [Cyanobacteria bacterium UBA11049]|nr:hypothetical protein [Cyanobacteria bacterium UBA11049]
MKTVPQEDLQALGQLLQERLRSHIPNGNKLKIGCAISNETLVVLLQHPPRVEFDPETTFAAIEKNLQSLRPQATEPVKLYLRVSGQKQAYAKHDITWHPSELATIANFPARSERKEIPVSALHSLDAIGLTNHNFSQHLTNWHNNEPLIGVRQQAKKTEGFSRKVRSLLADIPAPLLVVGGGVALATLFSSTYMLTRPCVIGECPALQTAQQLSKVANHLTQRVSSQPDLLTVQQRLVEANNSLKAIPRWSFRYQEASQLSQNLSARSAALEQISAALEKAAAATKKGENLPHTVQKWQEIQALWQQAIATLANIPANSSLFSLAQQKLVDYQTNLQVVNQHLNLEQQASKKLLQAKNTILLAKTRGDTARSWQAWQKVKATWQSAIAILGSIPKTTTAYTEAQQLQASYRKEIEVASDRATKEQMSAKAFSEAMSKANLAQKDEQQNQISLALSNWNQALNSAKQVPGGTQYYNQSQPLIAFYTSAIQQAGAKLKVANAMQLARTDLNRICSGTIRVCKYTLNNQLIMVQLTSGYEQAVERNYINAKLHTNSKTQVGVAMHYHKLKQALEAISNKANVPLQVYESDGSSLHNYKPK